MEAEITISEQPPGEESIIAMETDDTLQPETQVVLEEVILTVSQTQEELGVLGEEIAIPITSAEMVTTTIITTSASPPRQTDGPLNCNICDQQFGRQSHLTRHIETCHGERGTYQCSDCTASFKRKDSLSRHMSTQHGENPRPFKCTVQDCERDFNRKDHLNKHLRQVHKIEPMPSTPGKSGGDDGDDSEIEDEERIDAAVVVVDSVANTLMIKDMSSLTSPPPIVVSNKNSSKQFKCSSDDCDAEYTSLDHLHRHVSRGHTLMMQPPMWGHSIFGAAELKFEVIEGETTLCMFCCSTYQHNKEIEKQRKSYLANDAHFTKFCEAALRQQRKRMSANTIIKSLNSLTKLSVCQKCFNKISYAMGTKVAADEVNARVAELRRQLDAELKHLASEVDQFHVEMKQIEDTIRSADMSCLENYLAAIESPDEKEQSSVVLLLRDGIFAVMNEVEVYCSRMRGQQVVVNTPSIPRKANSTLGSAKGASGSKKRLRQKKKRRTKHKGKSSLNPLLHVKVEHGKGGEDSENLLSDRDDVDDLEAITADDTLGIDKSLTFASTSSTPRRQPVREARVKTEEFLKNLFEKQKAGDAEDLEAIIKTEIPSDTEGETGELIGETMETNLEGGDKTGNEVVQTGVEDKITDPIVGSDAANDAAVKSQVEEGVESKKLGEGEKSTDGEDKDKEGKEPVEPAPIEEILIDGDELEEFFYDEGETSDEDFHLDAALDDGDSRSESSESESDISFEGSSDEEEEDEPVPKKARGRPPRQRSKKTDFDPFNFKRVKKSVSRPTKTKSNNKLAQQHNIDMSGMSDFRKRLLLRILKKNSKAGAQDAASPRDPLSTGEADPRVNFRFEYSKELGTLLLGDVQVIIHDDHSSLQCAKCGYLSSPAEKPRRSVPRIMYNHILGKHLFAFQCPQCSATLGSYRRYLDHIKGHQMGFVCDVCGKPLFSEEALRRHRWGHMNADEMTEAIRSGVKDPRRKHDPTLTFQCTTCGKVFAKKMLLRQHEKTHAENRERIVCTLCGKTFLPSGFISHQKYSCFPEGYEPPRVQCQLCPSTFKSVVLRARHMKYAHSTASIEKPYKCHICGKGFAANEHLQKHIKRHSDARPYLCRKGCGANYKTRKDCTRHEKKCEGSGTPMMRHKGRNDQLTTPKQEPGLETVETITASPIPNQGLPPQIIIQTQTTTQQPQTQQFNVYNIL